MFDEMPDQFYQFLAASRASNSVHIHHSSLSFSLNGCSFGGYPSSFEEYPVGQSASVHHDLGVQIESCVGEKRYDEGKEEWSGEEVLALLRIRSGLESWFPDFTWEHVSRKLAELGFRRSAAKCKEKFEEESRHFNNTINNCNNISKTTTTNNNYRLFGELEELYNGDQHHHSNPQPCTLSENNQDPDKENEKEEAGYQQKEEKRLELDCETTTNARFNEDQYSADDSEKTVEKTKRVNKKRKRHEKKFELFKGFCENVVNKMMARQEELHNKILQDMVKRDEEKMAREEAWKKQETERMNKEMETRALEQAIASDRQAIIIEFLKKFASTDCDDTCINGDKIESIIKVPNTSSSSILTQSSLSPPPTSSDSMIPVRDHQNPSPSVTQHPRSYIPTSPNDQNLHPHIDNSKALEPIASCSLMEQASKNNNSTTTTQRNPSSITTHDSERDHTSTDTPNLLVTQKSPTSATTLKGSTGDRDDVGRRWPRDEVLALINIRCSHFNNNGEQNDQNREQLSSKGPLWERISQKMLELGYKRSAKRCKEKWENINKYFRKTKDTNKKRSIDSRTCPYFHQLSHLYSHGTLVGPSEKPENQLGSPENQLGSPENRSSWCETGQGGAEAVLHGPAEGREGVVQVPALDFEF